MKVKKAEKQRKGTNWKGGESALSGGREITALSLSL